MNLDSSHWTQNFLLGMLRLNRVDGECAPCHNLPIACATEFKISLVQIVMPKPKRKLIADTKTAKKMLRLEFMTILINGQQKRVRRPSTIDGTLVDAVIQTNADSIWLHQHGYWEYIMLLDDGDCWTNCQPRSDIDVRQPLFGDPAAGGSVYNQEAP